MYRLRQSQSRSSIRFGVQHAFSIHGFKTRVGRQVCSVCFHHYSNLGTRAVDNRRQRWHRILNAADQASERHSFRSVSPAFFQSFARVSALALILHRNPYNSVPPTARHQAPGVCGRGFTSEPSIRVYCHINLWTTSQKDFGPHRLHTRTLSSRSFRPVCP